MRILVTGATGFIGTHTVRALVDAGHGVRLLVRDAEKARRLWADRPEVLEDLVVGKITSGPATAAALDASVHLDHGGRGVLGHLLDLFGALGDLSNRGAHLVDGRGRGLDDPM